MLSSFILRKLKSVLSHILYTTTRSKLMLRFKDFSVALSHKLADTAVVSFLQKKLYKITV
jgi:hypothetical protein